MAFVAPAAHKIKLKECEKKDKYLDLARELKKYGIWRWQLYQGTGGRGSWRTRRDHPNYSIIENGQNIEKSPGDLRRPAVT